MIDIGITKLAIIGGIALERLLLARIATFLETRCSIELEPGSMHVLDLALNNEYLMRTGTSERYPESRTARSPGVGATVQGHRQVA